VHAVRITVICEECVRIEYAPDGRFCDYPSLFAVNGPSGDPAIARAIGSNAFACKTTTADAGSPPITLRTKRFSLTYTPDGRPPHAGNMHALIEHPCPPANVPQREGKVLWTPDSRTLHNLGGTLSTLDGLRGPLPLGDGLLARDGWHLVDDSRRHVLVNGWAASREKVGLYQNTDWYLFAYGDDYGAALRAMTVIAGRVPMPRKYALGAWYSRYWPYTSDEYRGIVDEFEVHGFPLDVLVLDMDWHKPGWTGWSWNRQLLPDAEELVSWLHARGLAVTLNLHPADGVAKHEDRYPEFMRAIGREPDGTTVPFDAGDRRYMEALFEQVHKPLEHSDSAHPASPGVDFWWVDWQQDRFVRSMPGLTNLRWLNYLYFQQSSREPTSGEPGLRGMNFSRWAADEGGAEAGTEWGSPATGGWGDHRHPIHFSGDAHTGWDMLAFQVPFTAAAGNIGCFFWSHDIGGHFGPRLEEATTRWIQFGALSAALRLHSARTATLDRRPWTYEERFCDAMRAAFDLRSRLMPYLYSCVRACHERMLPLLRPMYLSHPRQERAYLVPAQYMLGDDLLAAPIVAPGMGGRCIAPQHVWFPAAASACSGWYNLLSGERHEPGEEAIVAAPIDQTPLFVRAGVLLPAQPATHRMTTDPLRTLVLHAFPGAAGESAESTLYEDDGLTRAHEQGRFAATPLVAKWTHELSNGGLRVTLNATIGPTRGQFSGQPDRRALQFRIGGVHRPLEAAVNGQPVSRSFNAEDLGGLMVVDAPEGDIRAQISIRLVFESANARLISHRTRLANLSAATGRDISTAHLRDSLLAACAALPPDHASLTALLAIGAGIGAAAEDHSLRFIDSLGWIDHSAVQAEVIERLGTHESVLSSTSLTLAPTAGHARAAALALPLAPLDVPPLGLRRTRLGRFRFSLHGTPLLIEHVAATAIASLTRFSVVGPFAWDWRHEIAHITEAPETAALNAAATFTGRGGAPVSWRTAAPGPKWPVDLRASFGERDGLAYAATVILSPRRQEATLHFSAGDKLEAFLNGAKIITLDDHSPHGAAFPSASVTLQAGRNELLIKLCDGGGGWGFVASIEAHEAVTHEALSR
jgi:alpha-glucosidase (family GH31 glycosyl hydrolase)